MSSAVGTPSRSRSISPLAGQAGPEGDADRCGPARTRIFRAPARRERPQPDGQLRHQRTSRLAAARHVHRSAHPGHHAGHLRLPARARARMARCTWARIRTRCPIRRSAPRSKSWRPTAWRPSFSETTASRRRRSSRGPSSSTTAAAKQHLADGIVITPSHNPPEDGGFKYNPTNGGPADTDVTHWVQDRANELLRGKERGREARAVRRGHQGGDHAPGRLRPALRPRSAERRRHGRHSRRRPQAGRGSARRRVRALLGADQRRSTIWTSRS